MDATIRYNRKIPIWKYALGFAALGIGILGLISLIMYSVVPFLFGFMMLKTEGSEIDLESKKYRNTSSVLGLKTGTWQAINNAEYISVFSTAENVTWRYLTAETTNTLPIIELNIFCENNKKITAYKTKKLRDAFDVASHIADALLIDLLDATEKGDYKWVDKDILRETGEIIYID